jgi:hypothetical protein
LLFAPFALSLGDELEEVGNLQLHDGDGLMLPVRESGQASWVARIQHNGSHREFGLGSLRAVRLSEAREKAALVKSALIAGPDPHLALKPPKELTRTFREAALGFLEANAADAKISDAKRKQNLSQLKAYAFPDVRLPPFNPLTQSFLHHTTGSPKQLGIWWANSSNLPVIRARERTP